jgi:hypothetical protein
LDFLKDKEKEVLIIIAIATFLALILELGILYLQNQQIQASNKQVHFNRKTELIKFLYDTKSTIDCPRDKNCTNEPKYNFRIRTVAFQEYINSYIKEDPNLAGAFLNDIQSPFVNIPVQININLNNFNADIPESMKINFFERIINRIKNIISFYWLTLKGQIFLNHTFLM